MHLRSLTNRKTQEKTKIQPPKQLYTAAVLIALLSFNFRLLANPIEASMPLWGGGAILVTDQPQDNQIRLHHFDHLDCGACHNFEQPSDNTNTTDDSIWKTGVDINKSCSMSDCHSYDKTMNHPVGTTITAETPKDMPTDSSSKMTCITCHNAESKIETSAEGETLERYLQIPDSKQLCASCHTTAAGYSKNNAHWQFSEKAHLTPLSPASQLKQNTLQSFASVDDESQNCLSCHDDVSAVVPAMNETKEQRVQRYRKMSDHPVGMNFQHKANRKAGSFKHPMQNSDKIRLFDGRVGCGSCHSLYSEKKSYLTVEYEGGHLCRSCHNR